MTEVILGFINSQQVGLKDIEKAVKEIEEKYKEQMRANILEASNQLCVEFKSLQREDVRVRRIIARVFGDDKCIGKRKNGRPCGNKSMTGLDGYCKTCYKSKPPESRVISFGAINTDTVPPGIDIGDMGTCVLTGAGSTGFPGTPISTSPPPEDELRDLPPLY